MERPMEVKTGSKRSEWRGYDRRPGGRRSEPHIDMKSNKHSCPRRSTSSRDHGNFLNKNKAIKEFQVTRSCYNQHYYFCTQGCEIFFTSCQMSQTDLLKKLRNWSQLADTAHRPLVEVAGLWSMHVQRKWDRSLGMIEKSTAIPPDYVQANLCQPQRVPHGHTSHSHQQVRNVVCNKGGVPMWNKQNLTVRLWFVVAVCADLPQLKGLCNL